VRLYKFVFRFSGIEGHYSLLITVQNDKRFEIIFAKNA